jgi:hypothetical protein
MAFSGLEVEDLHHKAGRCVEKTDEKRASKELEKRHDLDGSPFAVIDPYVFRYQFPGNKEEVREKKDDNDE